MSSDTDKKPPDSPEPSEDISRDELEEALNWLENLAARQGTSLEGLAPLESEGGVESPFRGLFESDEGELPDWLRELPSDPDKDQYPDRSSHMDWLARMANEESVEELPTLQWRQLSNYADDIETDEDSQTESDDNLADLFDEPSPSQTATLAIVDVEESTEVPEDDAGVENLHEASELEEAAAAEEAVINLPPPAPLVAVDLEAEDIDEAESVNVSDVELPGEAQAEDVSAEAVVDPVVYPEPDDLDAAMAWLEELAASTDAPVEDLPSVADRALASKLIAEAISSEPAEPAPPSVKPVELPDSDSVESDTWEPVIEHINETIPEPTDAISSRDNARAPASSVADAGRPAPPESETGAELATNDPLAELDKLAVPAGRSLEAVAALLATLPAGFMVSPYSLESTLDWLVAERPGAGAVTELLDPDLVAAMPEDPDEALQWLESMSEPDLALEARGDSKSVSEQSSTAVEMTEADLLDMPDDPDEAMAWIESLASRGGKKQ